MPNNTAAPLASTLVNMADLLNVFAAAIAHPVEVDGKLCAVLKLDDLASSFSDLLTLDNA